MTLPSDREIRITRSFEAPRASVFEAWTSPEHLPKWMLGPPGWRMTICEIDLRVGGATRVVWEGLDGKPMEIRSTYREVVVPERLVAVESWGAEWPETVNTEEFEESAGRTTVVLTFLYPTQEARDAALQSGMAEGMEFGFGRLDEHLRSID